MTSGNKLSRLLRSFYVRSQEPAGCLCKGKSHNAQIGQRIIVVLFSFIFTFGLFSFFKADTVEASAVHKFKWDKTWFGGDAGNFSITVSGYKEQAKVKLKVSFPHEAHVVFWNGKKSGVPGDDQSYYYTFTFQSNGTGTMKIGGQANGNNVTSGKVKVSRVEGELIPTKTTAKKKKKVVKKTVKKATPTKKPTSKPKKAAVKAAATTTTAFETTETTVTALAAKVETIPSTEPSEEEPAPVDVNLSHDSVGKNKKSFAWLWFVLALVVAGLSYLRIRKLRNDGKTGKDLALDFIPGVGDLVYAVSGSNTKYAPIASDAQHGYSYNPAAGKKEIKAIDEEEERAARSAFKPAPVEHTPIKRPKELSVNRAAFVASAAGTNDKEEDAATQKPAAATPFKPAEGITRARSVNPNEVFKTEVSHTTDEIMSSAFKPSAGSRPTDKIVTSAFKPAAGSHTSEKIVSSAVKPTSKFTPQRSASATVQQDSDAVRQARERAEAAREQQAMRAAMRTGRTVAEVKGEAKPATNGPVSRPSAFGTNRTAASASAAKSTFNPVAAPPRTKTGSTNSNQLGSMLAGKSNGAARTPVWASRGAATVNPFKQAGETEAAEPEEENKAMSSYGTAVSSSAILQGDQHVTDTRYKAAKGRTLEGQRPAIADPSAHVAPTATQPVFGFKPIDPGSQND